MIMGSNAVNKSANCLNDGRCPARQRAPDVGCGKYANIQGGDGIPRPHLRGPQYFL